MYLLMWFTTRNVRITECMYMESMYEFHVALATKTWAVHDIMKQVSYILVSVFDGPWNVHNLENNHLAVGHTFVHANRSD